MIHRAVPVPGIASAFLRVGVNDDATVSLVSRLTVPPGCAHNFQCMRIDVRLFALYRERAGASVVTVDVPDHSTVGQLTSAVRVDYPRLAPPEVRIVVAVNAEYADDDLVLHPGDEVCLIPPVSGGR